MKAKAKSKAKAKVKRVGGTPARQRSARQSLRNGRRRLQRRASGLSSTLRYHVTVSETLAQLGINHATTGGGFFGLARAKSKTDGGFILER
jgi:Flp pilus assembly protein TadB